MESFLMGLGSLAFIVGVASAFGQAWMVAGVCAVIFIGSALMLALSDAREEGAFDTYPTRTPDPEPLAYTAPAAAPEWLNADNSSGWNAGDLPPVRPTTASTGPAATRSGDDFMRAFRGEEGDE